MPSACQPHKYSRLHLHLSATMSALSGSFWRFESMSRCTCSPTSRCTIARRLRCSVKEINPVSEWYFQRAIHFCPDLVGVWCLLSTGRRSRETMSCTFMPSLYNGAGHPILTCSTSFGGYDISSSGKILALTIIDIKLNRTLNLALASLTFLELYGTYLKGNIPSAIEKLLGLRHLELGQVCKSLKTLIVSKKNKLNGPVHPSELGTSSSWKH